MSTHLRCRPGFVGSSEVGQHKVRIIVDLAEAASHTRVAPNVELEPAAEAGSTGQAIAAALAVVNKTFAAPVEQSAWVVAATIRWDTTAAAAVAAPSSELGSLTKVTHFIRSAYRIRPLAKAVVVGKAVAMGAASSDASTRSGAAAWPLELGSWPVPSGLWGQAP